MNFFNIKIILRKVIFFIFIFCSYSIASDVENFELSSDPCGDLYKKISQNIKSLQNAPYLSGMYFGFEVEPAFVDGHELDGISEIDEIDDYLMVTYIPQQNKSTFYTETESGEYVSYILSNNPNYEGKYKINGLMEGDRIYSINGTKPDMDSFYEAWQSLYLNYGKKYSFVEYLLFDLINDDLKISIDDVDTIKLGIFRPSEFNENHEIDFQKDLIYVDITSNVDYPMIPAELELDVSKIIEINSKDNYFEADYKKNIINWDKFKLTEIATEIFGDNNYFCFWEDTDPEFGVLQTIWLPTLEWVNRIGFDKDQIKQKIIITYYSEIIENDCPCAVVSYSEDGIAKFQTYFDYRSFPFDKQNLNISIFNYGQGITYGTDTVFWNFADAKPKFVGGEFISPEKKRRDISGWSLNTDETYDIEIFKVFDASKFRSEIEEGIVSEDSVTWDTRDEYTYKMNWTKSIERQWIYFFFKIIAPLVLILLICWSVFWTPSRELESRLTVTITCFLALVAYTFVIDDDLPQLAYLTLMDYIILVTYFFASLPTVLSILSYNLAKKDEYSNIVVDKYIRLIGPSLYILVLYVTLTLNVNDANTLPIAKSLVIF